MQLHLRYIVGFQSNSSRIKGCGLIIAFLRLAVVLGDFEN